MECFDELTAVYTKQKPAKWYYAKIFIMTMYTEHKNSQINGNSHTRQRYLLNET